jgi:hypothetical protein
MEYLGKTFIAKEGGRTRRSPITSPICHCIYIINDAWHRGIIDLPLASSYGLDFPTSQCADDTHHYACY